MSYGSLYLNHLIGLFFFSAFTIIFGIFYAIFSVTSFVVGTKAQVLGMARDFLTENIQVFTPENLEESTRRVFTALENMSKLYEK